MPRFDDSVAGCEPILIMGDPLTNEAVDARVAAAVEMMTDDVSIRMGRLRSGWA